MQPHWSDFYAQKILKERKDASSLTCASGITPSGTVHIGNFREIISVELIVRSLSHLGKTPRFIYSWDDFDVFRKVPANLPNTAEYEQYLRMPITDIPDPWKRADSYAKGNEHDIETILSRFGIHPQYIYQSQEYRKGVYAQGIKDALAKKSQIKAILDKYRTQPLPDDWWPISIFSNFTNKDTTTILSWDGEWNITYRCDETKKEETIDIRNNKCLKLLWRIDWPMRWKHEQVVFEPAGKDHHSQGGSFDTAKDIISEVYNFTPPITFQYGFVKIKGGKGKLSSSSGEVVSVSDVLEVYEPEIIRYLFVGTRPEAEFAISFDLDVIKIYEDYDRCERIYFGQEEVGEARKQKETRIYELSQINYKIENAAKNTNAKTSTNTGNLNSRNAPLQFAFRHLCNVLQIYNSNLDKTYNSICNEYGKAEVDKLKEKLYTRMQCAINWINMYAPDDFKFSIRDKHTLSDIKESEQEVAALAHLKNNLIKNWDNLSDKDINEYIYASAREFNLDPKEFFTTLYRRLINQERGPRLGNFLKILGLEVISTYL